MTVLAVGAVLLLNAIIGTVQEFSAQRAATALQQLVTTCTRVLRDGDTYEVDAEELVPGDIVLLESGDRVHQDQPRLQVLLRRSNVPALTRHGAGEVSQ